MNLTHLRMRTEKVSRRRHLLSHTKNNLNICVIRTVCFINISVRCSNFNSSKRKEKIQNVWTHKEKKQKQWVSWAEWGIDAVAEFDTREMLPMSFTGKRIRCETSHSCCNTCKDIGYYMQLMGLLAAGVGMRLNK